MSRSTDRARLARFGVALAFVAVACDSAVSAAPKAASPVATPSQVTPSQAMPSQARSQGGPAEAPVGMPEGLAARIGTIELSGVAWSEALSRYLLVSDDIATAGDGKKHLPWAFAMSADGKLDDAPLPITGIDELNDPESICQGPDGTFFLATSHSTNTKGHLPKSRRQLLQLAVDAQKRALRVVGRFDLTEARGAKGESLAEVAGLESVARLDIEAIAFHEGALFVGLKAPLLSDGRATILRLSEPLAALSGNASRSALSLYAHPRLCVPHEGTEACEGVADMVFLPESAGGGLLLVANAPKAMPPDGGGALYRLASPSSPAKLVRHFAGRKPEGVTLSADRASAVLVFDRDREKPLWLTWPLNELPKP